MKGVIFTEFLEMVEEKFGLERVDQVIMDANLPSEGAYTSVGNYPHTEMVSMVMSLHRATQIPVTELLVSFGRFLFGRFASHYDTLLKGIDDPFELLENLEKVIHQEVKKLYPDARPPMIETVTRTPDSIVMIYNSHRAFSAVAEGLILGCSDYYGIPLAIAQEYLQADGTKVRFTVTKL